MTEVAQIGPVRKLVSFLGLGRLNKAANRREYEPTIYRWGPRRLAEPTPYVCHALCQLLGNSRPQQIAILATEEAEAAHGAGLRQALGAGSFPEPQIVRIPKGESVEQLRQQFQIIKQELRGCPGTILLDITHGFRSQPFFAAAVSAFVRAVDEAPSELEICYAAFEAKDDAGVAPIWELSEFVGLLDWAQALHVFLLTGRATEAAAKTKRLGGDLARAWQAGGKRGNPPNLAQLGDALAAFSRDLETLRTGDLLIGRKMSSSERLLSATRQAREEVAVHLPALADVLDRVVDMVTPLGGSRDDLSGADGRKAVAALADIYLRLGRWLEAVATVREGWMNLYAAKTALCPGAQDFSKSERDLAEAHTYARDALTFQTVTDRRNDLLHAQYRSRNATQDAAAAAATVSSLVAEFQKVSRRARCLVNLTNHPSSGWDEAQTKAALEFVDEIKDFPFPLVPPNVNEEEIEGYATNCVSGLPACATHALVQGEFTLTVALVRRLQACGITCFAATTERQVETTPDGRKISSYRFVRFRKYPSIEHIPGTAEPGLDET